MNKENLSKKLKFILSELKMNRKEFIEACNKINPYISRPTILNLINGKSKGLPRTETLDTIIKVCQNSNSDTLKNISYDYLMNENVENTTNLNMRIGEAVGLSDNAISVMQKNYTYNDAMSNFIENVDVQFWEYLKFIKDIQNIQVILLQLQNLFSSVKSYDIADAYANFKKQEILNAKKRMQKLQYTNYLRKQFNDYEFAKDIKDINELEENLFTYYKQSCGNLSSSLFNFLQEAEKSVDNEPSSSNNFLHISSSNFSNSSSKGSKDSSNELEYFKNYLMQYYSFDKNNFELDQIEKSFNELSNYYVSTFLIQFLRKNFKTQYLYIKNKGDFHLKFKTYKASNIAIDQQILDDFYCEIKDFYDSLDGLKRILKLTIFDKINEII